MTTRSFTTLYEHGTIRGTIGDDAIMHRIGDLTLDATRVNAVMDRAVNVGNIVWWRFVETRLLTFFRRVADAVAMPRAGLRDISVAIWTESPFICGMQEKMGRATGERRGMDSETGSLEPRRL